MHVLINMVCNLFLQSEIIYTCNMQLQVRHLSKSEQLWPYVITVAKAGIGRFIQGRNREIRCLSNKTENMYHIYLKHCIQQLQLRCTVVMAQIYLQIYFCQLVIHYLYKSAYLVNPVEANLKEILNLRTCTIVIYIVHNYYCKYMPMYFEDHIVALLGIKKIYTIFWKFASCLLMSPLGPIRYSIFRITGIISN